MINNHRKMVEIIGNAFDDFMDQKCNDEGYDQYDHTDLDWKYIWLCDELFRVVTYNDDLSIKYGKAILEVLTIIRDRDNIGVMSEYIKDSNNYNKFILVCNLLNKYELINWNETILDCRFEFIGYDFNFTFIRCLAITEHVDGEIVKTRESNYVDWSKEAVDYLLDEFFKEEVEGEQLV